MPIRINLKELFAADPQEISVDKINFNFNKLLELGIGEPGPIGKTGPVGSAGPIGLTGDDGIRGASWFVGTGDPNSNTFTDLLDGDFYIDTVTSTIWQYDLETDTWSIVVDLENVVNNFLTAAGSPFVRGFGEVSPDDDRFIVFSNRGNTPTDILLDVTLGSSSNNDILFLNNFNEKITSIDNFPVSTNDEYNALQKIYIDSTSGVPGRYHLEFGTLYQDGLSKLLSSLNENLKVRYLRDPLFIPIYGSTNNHINIARYSLSVPETISVSNINFNALFEWIAPKYNNEFPGPATYQNFTSRLGAKEALGEYASYISTDGLSLHLGSKSVAIGINDDYDAGITSALNGLSFLMLDHSDNINGIFLNKNVYQNNGDIEQLGYTAPRETAAVVAPYSPAVTDYGRMGIAVMGNNLFTVSHPGNNVVSLSSDYGYFNLFSIDNSKVPTLLKSDRRVGRTSTLTSISDTCDLGSRYVYGAGVSDVAVLDNLAYVVNNISENSAPNTSGSGNFYNRLAFQIIQYDQNQGQFKRVSELLSSTHPQELEAISEIKLYNNYAITVSKNFETVLGNTGDTYNEGRINAINISDSGAPLLLNSLGQARTNYLALEVIDDYAVTLTFEQGVPDGGRPTSTVSYLRVYVDVYDLKSLNPDPRSFHSGTVNQVMGLVYSTRTTPSAFVNNGVTPLISFLVNYNINKQLGAITGTKERVFVGYKNTIKVFNLLQNTCYNPIFPPAYTDLPQDTSFTVSLDSDFFISDMKLIGNTLYVLAKNLDSSGAGAVRLLKFDVTDIYSPIQISDTPITYDSAAKFVVVGKMLYLCIGNGNGAPALLALEFDGIKAPSAEIQALRSDHVNITQTLDVGESAKIHNRLEVGKGGIYSKRINTNQIWGNVSLIDPNLLILSKGQPLTIAPLSPDPRYAVTDTVGAGYYSINITVAGPQFLNVGNNLVFAFNITPVNYDRYVNWYMGGNQLFYPDPALGYTGAFLYIDYLYGSSLLAPTYEIKRKLCYHAYEGDGFFIPADQRMLMFAYMVGPMVVGSNGGPLSSQFIFRAQKVGLGSLSTISGGGGGGGGN